MRDHYTQALAILDQSTSILRRCPASMWAYYVRALVHQIEAHPLLAAIVGEVELSRENTKDWLTRPGPPPSSLSDWGLKGYASLKSFTDRVPRPRPKDVLTDLGCGQFEGFNDKRWQDRQNEELYLQFVAPMVSWLKAELGSEPLLNLHIERWCQRTEWFPPQVQDEADLQVDLHRWLFDSGVSVWDAGRELHTARGHVDFALRDGRRAAVELKLWRDGTSASDLKRWAKQASDYPRDLGIELAYLVVANVSDSTWLDIGGVPGAVLPVQGIRALVRTVDLKRGASSKDGAKRRRRELTRADFGL